MWPRDLGDDNGGRLADRESLFLTLLVEDERSWWFISSPWAVKGEKSELRTDFADEFDCGEFAAGKMKRRKCRGKE